MEFLQREELPHGDPTDRDSCHPAASAYARRHGDALNAVADPARLLEAAPGIKYRAALGVAYGAGLRVSEVTHLRADDIDSKRMLIRIEEGILVQGARRVQVRTPARHVPDATATFPRSGP
ncbi:tyrosine-type recombinase/integrase [Sphingomonas molluscorum]|uniref:tyrosine-type recombinase/integrase n=1 Tax=Sphingomonas molluscorum TaxID=418184 RepID=UPI0031DD93DB